jgi:6-phosphofructokinase
VMGRQAGWIALEAGIAGGADVILIPEIPYDLQAVREKIEERSRRGAKFSLVVVAEGAYPQGGQAVYLDQRDLGGARRLGGIGERLAQQLHDCCELEVRVTVLGHLQRGGSPSAFDRLLASRFGTMAVHLIAEGKLGHMVALQDGRIQSVPLAQAIAHLKLVPLDSDILQTARGLGICLGDV